MKKSTLFLGVIAAITLAGCKPATDSQPAGTTPDTAATNPTDIQAPATDAAAPATTSPIIEIPTAAEGGTPHLLSAGTSLSGSFNSPQAGELRAVGLQIGNYDGSADGTATLKVCQAEICQEGTANIVGSTDNSYLTFSLTSPLAVTSGSVVTYTFNRVDGVKPFAIWTYPTTGKGEVTLPDGSKAPRDGKLSVMF